MLKQGFQQKLQQKLSPLQIQLMKLIQLPTQAFEQKLSQEVDENPALEKGKTMTLMMNIRMKIITTKAVMKVSKRI